MSKLPFPSTIVTHALVETCVFGGLTYYLTGRISSLEKRVKELEDLLLERLRKDHSRLNPRPVDNPPQTTEESLPAHPPLVRQNANIQSKPTEPTDKLYKPLVPPTEIPIEIELTQQDPLKAIDAEVEKEIAELNLK